MLLVIAQLIFLEGILSLDNAAVLGAMVISLPRTEPIPWPRPLRWLGPTFDGVLGMQREAALKVGLLGAYLGRGVMLLLATIVMHTPWLRLLGGLYLFYLALNYLAMLGRTTLPTDDPALPGVVLRSSFWSVVLAVELADLAFSLDNVVAAVALSDQYWVVLVGIAIGMLLMRYAASVFSRLILWEPKLEIAAYLLILAISIEMLLDDLWQIHFVPFHLWSVSITAEMQQFGVTVLILSSTLAFARLRWLQSFNTIWHPVLWFCTFLLYPLHWISWPLRAFMRLV